MDKVKRLVSSANEETKQKLRRGEVSISGAYIDLMKKEHEGEIKTCERCKQEKPMSDFNIPSNRHAFSALCKRCEAEISRAAKTAAEVAFRTTEPVATQPVSDVSREIDTKPAATSARWGNYATFRSTFPRWSRSLGARWTAA